MALSTITGDACKGTQSILSVRQDWERDGFLVISGARTIKRYNELMQQQNNLPVDKWGIFFAFSPAQFKTGYKGLLDRGLIKEGEVIKDFGGGCFGTSAGMKRWVDEINAVEEKIRQECDPYEVYLDEYNNFECCIDWDGDDRAVERVLGIFGLARTKEALNGKRFRICSTIETLYNSMRK